MCMKNSSVKMKQARQYIHFGRVQLEYLQLGMYICHLVMSQKHLYEAEFVK